MPREVIIHGILSQGPADAVDLRMKRPDLDDLEVGQVESGIPALHWQVKPKPLVCRAGSVFIIHYDLWHRGGANLTKNAVRTWDRAFTHLSGTEALCSSSSSAAC